jgi:hypothetical protein
MCVRSSSLIARANLSHIRVRFFAGGSRDARLEGERHTVWHCVTVSEEREIPYREAATRAPARAPICPVPRHGPHGAPASGDKRSESE